MEAENGSAGTAAAQPVKVESQEGQPEGKVTSEDPAAAAEALLEQILADLREMSVMLEAPTPEMSQEIFDTQNRILLHYQHLHKLAAECDNVLIPKAVLELLDQGKHPEEYTKSMAQDTKKAIESSARRGAALQALHNSLAGEATR